MNISLFIKKSLKHELISGSFYLFAGGMIANVLAFLYNLFLARTLIPADYGIYGSLLSIITLVGIPAGSMGPMIIKFAADYFAKNEIVQAAKLYSKMFQFIFSIAVLLLVIFVVFSGPIKSFLNIKNTMYIVFSGIIISFYYLTLINSSYIQSVVKFKALAFINVLSALAKIVTGGLLVLAGFKVYGALGGVFALSFSTFIISFWPIRFIFKSIKNNKTKIPIREIVYYALPTSLAILFLTSFTSVDVILVKHFFSPSKAGFYAGLSLVGKVILYFTAPIPVVMFPLLVKRHALGKSFNRLFYLALLLVILPSFAITVFYFVFSSFTVRFFLGGGAYMRVTPYLGLFGIYITIVSLLNVCVNFFLSLKQTKIALVVGLGTFLQVLLIIIFHENFYQIIGISIFASLLVLIILIVLFFKKYFDFKELSNTIASVNNPTI